MLSGCLSAGVLSSGVILLVLALAAPSLISGSGLGRAAGPQPDRIVVPLVVGAITELLRHYRLRWNSVARAALALLGVVCSLGALWWGWWR